jgi:hypothetical protein
MQQIGHAPPSLIAARSFGRSGFAWAVAGLVAALAPALWMWGFTVDDALIPVRYAHHVGLGLGWRFNAHGPSTDGVTPLPWPLLLLPAGRLDPLATLLYAKALGLVAWACTGGALGAAMARARGCLVRAAALVVLALSVPVAAYAVSGMETALATSLATLAVLSSAKRPWMTVVLAGLAASLRPEMAAWALVLAAGTGIATGWPSTGVAAAASLSLVPFVACTIVRSAAWGRPAPLALLAKPSDLDHGLAYAEAAIVVTLTPILAVAPWALRRSPLGLAIVAAALVHVAAVVVVGGDWMPYARLMVPIAPSLAWASVLAAEHAAAWASGIRTVAAVAMGIVLVARGGTSGRSVGADRAALVRRARPALADAHRVAALDIGWVGASTDADIVDLAGLTDPAIASLPGGHTSKRVDGMFLLSRDPDALLLYALSPPHEGSDLDHWMDARYARAVEARLAADPVVSRHFVAKAWLPLGAAGAGYVLLAKRTPE